jgi:hypothetical protein
VAEARESFSELLREAAKRPQLIFSRDRPVAAVVNPEIFEEFQSWQESRQGRTIGQAFAELRRLCAEERYTLELPEREDRPNVFADVVDESAR